MKPYHEHMTECPKCGWLKGFRPEHHLNVHGLEFLRWKCGACGFYEDTRCKDQSPPPTTDDRAREALRELEGEEQERLRQRRQKPELDRLQGEFEKWHKEKDG